MGTPQVGVDDPRWRVGESPWGAGASRGGGSGGVAFNRSGEVGSLPLCGWASFVIERLEVVRGEAARGVFQKPHLCNDRYIQYKTKYIYETDNINTSLDHVPHHARSTFGVRGRSLPDHAQSTPSTCSKITFQA